MSRRAHAGRRFGRSLLESAYTTSLQIAERENLRTLTAYREALARLEL